MCRKIGKPSAQSTVYLLPDIYNRDAYLTDDSIETTEIPRVIKVAHSMTEAEIAVKMLGINDPDAQTTKLLQLIVDGRRSTRQALFVAAQVEEVDLLLGYPQRTQLYHEEMSPDFYHMAYVQDLVRPVADILARLDTETNEGDLRTACRLVDDYIDAQLLVCSYGLYDPTFKLTDNCGQSLPDAGFDDDFSTFRIIDLGELSDNFKQLLEHIDKKEWRQIIHRKGTTQLPAPVQE